METIQPSAPAPVRPKIGRNVIGFWSVIIGTVLVVVLALVFLLTKLGLIRPPVFSWFYHGPQPARMVEVAPQDVQAFTQLLGKRFVEQELRSGGQQPSVSLQVTEAELTSILPEALKQAIQDPHIHIGRSQVVVLADRIELIAFFERSGIHLDISMTLVPRMQDGRVHFEPLSFRLGDVPLPIPVATQLMALLFGRDLGEWDIRSAELMPQDIRLSDGMIEIVLARLAR